MAGKVRRVRCPRCWNVLEELPDASLYSCGGCGNILQGKNWKSRSNQIEKSQEDAGAFEEKEVQSSEHVSTGPQPSLDSSPDKEDSGGGSIDIARPIEGSIVEGKEPSKQGNLRDLVSEECHSDDNGEPNGILGSAECTHEAAMDVPDLQEHEDPEANLPSDDVVPQDHVEKGQISLLFDKKPDSVGSVKSADQDLSSVSISGDDASQLEEQNLEAGEDVMEKIMNLDGEDSPITTGSNYLGVNTENGSTTKNATDDSYYTYTSTESSYNGIQEMFRDRDKYAETALYSIGASSDRLILPPPCLGDRPSRKASYSEMNRADLLRTVYELKDQIDRMQFPEVIENRSFLDRFVDRKFNRLSYNPYTVEQEAYSIKQYSRMAASRDSNCSGCSCSHHHVNDRSKSHRTCNDIKRSKSPEKRPVKTKRYVRPVAGAAPFIACYNCSELLHFPDDFLIFNRRSHRLMCNACKNVLKFSVVRGSFAVPTMAASLAPSPGNCSRNIEEGRRFGSMTPAESVGSSSDIGELRKSTNGIEQVWPLSLNHRLHSLMGYSSPSQVLDH
ncbi:protein ENHANCED DISEASE RESISTANCE 4-like [Andrographis paniculata]|uniref:protein ENHANCED DISEASE RESISTANCE 4-like n=1 Tax=Andrographis paniculata TaxID=175694 RepID=UPI0021E727AF|nr:protein ENHANCED DISEASE RESISTANCE 4-like [Andrographis paniculata]